MNIQNLENYEEDYLYTSKQRTVRSGWINGIMLALFYIVAAALFWYLSSEEKEFETIGIVLAIVLYIGGIFSFMVAAMLPKTKITLYSDYLECTAQYSTIWATLPGFVTLNISYNEVESMMETKGIVYLIVKGKRYRVADETAAECVKTFNTVKKSLRRG